MIQTKIRLFAIFAFFALTGCASQHERTTNQHPAMVVTANPHATQAGIEILESGGTAIDAAIAIEAVLSLVEPQSSGLAGGAFLLYFDQATREVIAYDGRETAPRAISDTQFLNEDGESIGFLNAKNSGLSTGVPGVLAMLQMAHKEHGNLPWGRHFDAAINLAEQGFEVSPRLHGMIARFGQYIPKSIDEGPIDAAEYFFDADGNPLQAGQALLNPEYADTLRTLAHDPDDFYHGEIADSIVAQVHQPPRAGALQKADLAEYTPKKSAAICIPYKTHTLCGPPPASSWVAVGQIMRLLEFGPQFSEFGSNDPSNWSTFVQAQQLAYADRDQFVADSNFVDVPLNGLLDPEYLRTRAALISESATPTLLKHGDPWQFESRPAIAMGKDATNDHAGTTHFVVVDSFGNVVSMTASVESIFGSTRMVGGMFLNNQLTDFSFKPLDESGNPIANRIEPKKRPRSSMSPTIVLDANGNFKMATGSPGGNSIIAYTAKTLVGVLDWGLSAQQAIELPNVVARGEQVRIESERASTLLIDSLKSKGFSIHESAGENSGLSVVVKQADGSLQGGADPRREGTIAVPRLSQ